MTAFESYSNVTVVHFHSGKAIVMYGGKGNRAFSQTRILWSMNWQTWRKTRYSHLNFAAQPTGKYILNYKGGGPCE